jgi:hypothetical protein
VNTSISSVIFALLFGQPENHKNGRDAALRRP